MVDRKTMIILRSPDEALDLALDIAENIPLGLLEQMPERVAKLIKLLTVLQEDAITCPDCGLVRVKADVFENGKGVSGICPTCKERLYFAKGGA